MVREVATFSNVELPPLDGGKLPMVKIQQKIDYLNFRIGELRHLVSYYGRQGDAEATHDLNTELKALPGKLHTMYEIKRLSHNDIPHARTLYNEFIRE